MPAVLNCPSGTLPSEPGAYSYMLVSVQGNVLINKAVCDGEQFSRGFLEDLQTLMEKHSVLSLDVAWLGGRFRDGA